MAREVTKWESGGDLFDTRGEAEANDRRIDRDTRCRGDLFKLFTAHHDYASERAGHIAGAIVKHWEEIKAIVEPPAPAEPEPEFVDTGIGVFPNPKYALDTSGPVTITESKMPGQTIEYRETIPPAEITGEKLNSAGVRDFPDEIDE
jgi:hypothetical protein